MPKENRTFVFAIEIAFTDFGQHIARRQIDTGLETQFPQVRIFRINPPAQTRTLAKDAFSIAESDSLGQAHFGTFQEQIYRVKNRVLIFVVLVVRTRNQFVKVPVRERADSRRFQHFCTFQVKAGMLRTERFGFQIKRKRFKEIQHFKEFGLASAIAFDGLDVNRYFVKSMLAQVASANSADDMPTISILVPKAERIKLMIAHQRHGRTRIAHITHEVYRLAHLAAAVDVIAQEDDRPRIAGIAVRTATFFVAQLFKEHHEFIVVPMNIADKVNGGVHYTAIGALIVGHGS